MWSERCASVSGPRATRWCRIGIAVSATIDSGAAYSRSWVSATGPARELSIGSTPYPASPLAAASTTSSNVSSERRSPCTGNSCSAAAALCAAAPPG